MMWRRSGGRNGRPHAAASACEAVPFAVVAAGCCSACKFQRSVGCGELRWHVVERPHGAPQRRPRGGRHSPAGNDAFAAELRGGASSTSASPPTADSSTLGTEAAEQKLEHVSLERVTTSATKKRPQSKRMQFKLDEE